MADWPEIYLLRHGETEWNAEDRMQGGLDSPLTARGRRQAERQREILAGLDLAGFGMFCSPQGRAFATAAIALRGLAAEIRTDDRLGEIRVGEWEGRRRLDIPDFARAAEQEGGMLSLYDTAPGGEGFAAFRARCLSFLHERQRKMVIVCHGMTSRMLRTILLGHEMDAMGEMGGGQGIVHHVRDGRQTRLE